MQTTWANVLVRMRQRVPVHAASSTLSGSPRHSGRRRSSVAPGTSGWLLTSGSLQISRDEYPPFAASQRVSREGHRGGAMPNVVVRYRTKPECAEENQRLVEKVFAELNELGSTGFSYTSLRLEDGVTFVHIVVEDVVV